MKQRESKRDKSLEKKIKELEKNVEELENYRSAILNMAEDAEESRKVLAKAKAEIEKSEQTLRSLNLVGTRLQRIVEPENVFRVVGEELSKFGFRIIIFLLDKEKKNLILTYSTIGSRFVRFAEKIARKKMIGFTFPVNKVATFKKLVKNRKAVFEERGMEKGIRELSPVIPLGRVIPKLMSLFGPQDGISAPILIRGDLYGIFTVFSPELTERDIPTVTAFANQIGAAIERAQLYRDLSKSFEELQGLDKAKDEFFNIVSHELVTPIVPIKGYSELLLEEKMGKLSTKQKESLDIVRRNTNRLSKMINGILDFSRINAGRLKLNIQNIQINNVIEDSVNDLQPLARTKDLDLKVGKMAAMPLVKADSARITQVLSNLIKNSIKFTPSKGKIRVWAEKKGKEVVVAVKDTGTGVAKENINKLFTKFYQVETSAKRTTEGLGLGLAISKGIIDAHKGKIWVESKLGKGSTFYFSLPIAMEAKK